MTNEDNRLSHIETLWSVVRRAHDGESGDSRQAQEQLLDVYGTAIRRYLRGALRDTEAADELYQEFALRFVKGDYASADPERGRFRSFLKTILSRLVAEYYRKAKRRKDVPLGSFVDHADDGSEQADDQEFTKVWRDELLVRAWKKLRTTEEETGRPVYTLMDARVANPKLSSAQLAELVSSELGRPISTSNVRVMLHRARADFANHLLGEVRDTLENPTRSNLEQELGDLGLLTYCRPALTGEEE